MELPQSIARLVVERARAEGVSPEELILDLLTRDLDPPARAREYVRAARELVDAALAVKAYAYWREGVRLGHGELWRYKTRLAGELGEWVHDAWAQANAMHVNFYEGWADRASVEKALERVRRLVEEVARLVGEA